MSCDPKGPLLAEVVKTTSDPYVGRVSLVRVFSGTIRPDATVHVSGHFSSFFGSSNGSTGSHEDHDEDERIGTLSFPLGKQQRPAGTVVAGDICAIGRLSQGRDRRHVVRQGRSAGAQTVDDARAAAADRRAAAGEDRRRQAIGGPSATFRRGPDAADRAEPRDAPDRAVVHGRSPCGRRAGRVVRTGSG